MAIEAFENWLVSRTSINMAFETVFLSDEHFYCCIFMLRFFLSEGFLNIQMLFFNTLPSLFFLFSTRHENVYRKRKKEEMRIDLGTHQVKLYRIKNKK